MPHRTAWRQGTARGLGRPVKSDGLLVPSQVRPSVCHPATAWRPGAALGLARPVKSDGLLVPSQVRPLVCHPADARQPGNGGPVGASSNEAAFGGDEKRVDAS